MSNNNNDSDNSDGNNSDDNSDDDNSDDDNGDDDNGDDDNGKLLFVKKAIESKNTIVIWYLENNGNLSKYTYTYYSSSDHWNEYISRSGGGGIGSTISENNFIQKLSTMLDDFDIEWDQSLNIIQPKKPIYFTYSYVDMDGNFVHLTYDYIAPTKHTVFTSPMTQDEFDTATKKLRDAYLKEQKKHQHIVCAIFNEIKINNLNRAANINLDSNEDASDLESFHPIYCHILPDNI